MADQNNKEASKGTANAVKNGDKQDKHEQSGQSVSVIPPAKKAKVPNSAPLTDSSRKTSASTSVTAGKQKKQQPPKKVNDDLDTRMSKLEALMINQAEQNKTFQHSILATLNTMMSDDHDDMSVTSDLNRENESDDYQNIPQSGIDHPISDEDEELAGPSNSVSSKDVLDDPSSDMKSHKSDKKEGENPKDKVDHVDDQDIGFAASFAIEKDVGKKIRADVAKSLSHALMFKMEDTKLKEAMDRHKCPSNCDQLQTPAVNAPIWSDIPPHTRSKDLKLQRIQRPLIAGLTAMAKLDNDYKLNQDIRDGFMLLANASYELSCLRKDMIKPDLNPTFHHLCRPLSNERVKKEKLTITREYASLLFGTELGKQVKDIQEERKATSGVMKRKQSAGYSGYRFKPYNKNSATRQGFQAAAAAAGWKSNSNPFLGKQNSHQFKRQPYYKNRNLVKRQDQSKPANNSPKTAK